jgi:GMP synthase-like glutamine amidotransferase
MKPVLIFRHIGCEGPGYLAEFLSGRGLPYSLVCIDQGEPVPESLAGAGGLVFMGGPMSVNDPLPWVARELDLIRRAADAGLPVLGHCLGGQLISRALGGQVGPNPVREVGWLPVRAVAQAADIWLKGLPETFEAFHWHGETFSLPAGATHLLRSEHCAHQAFACGNVLALQFHVEVTRDIVEEWIRAYPADFRDPSPTVQTAEGMRERLGDRLQVLRGVADRLYGQWVEGLAP